MWMVSIAQLLVSIVSFANYFANTPNSLSLGLGIIIYTSLAVHLGTLLVVSGDCKVIFFNSLCSVFGVMLTLCCSMNLGENGGPYGNMLRVQLICGIFQTILGFMNIKSYNDEHSDYVQVQEEVDSSTFSTRPARNAEVENAGPPQYDDIVAEFDKLPSYQEASEKANRKGRKLCIAASMF